MQDKGARGSLRAWLLLGLILIAAGGLRFWRIDAASFWLDEYLTVTLSSSHGFLQMDLPTGEVVESPPNYVRLDAARPWHQMWPNSFGDVHPPLFYLVLRIWRSIVPDSDLWIRALPAILSMLAIAVMFIAVHTQAGAVPALWASALMALAGVQIEYAQECRSYPLMLVCLLGCGAAILRIERFGFSWPRGAAVCLGAVGAAMTHYLAFPILIVIGLYTLLILRGRDRVFTVVSFAVAGLLFAGLWLPWMIGQKGGFWGKIAFTKEQAWTITGWLFHWVSLPSRFMVNSTSEDGWSRWLGVTWFVVPVLLMIRAPKAARPLLFWWMWLMLGSLAVAIGDLGREGRLLAIIRYTLMVSPAVYALGGLMLAHLAGWKRHIVPALLCAACIAALPGAYLRYKADWRGFDAYLAAQLTREDILVIFDPPEIPWRPRCDLIGFQYYHRTLDVPVVFLSTPPSPDVKSRILKAQNVWFFASFPHARFEQVFPDASAVEQRFVPMVGEMKRLQWRNDSADVR